MAGMQSAGRHKKCEQMCKIVAQTHFCGKNLDMRWSVGKEELKSIDLHMEILGFWHELAPFLARGRGRL